MARQDTDRYELTDAEKRDLIKLINEGPLPEKYRFLLFKARRCLHSHPLDIQYCLNS
jgi:hypothetical protein